MTSAQNNTAVHKQFWENLQVLAKHLDAEIVVGTYTYDKTGIGGKGAKRNTEEAADDIWWDPAVVPYIHDKRRNIGHMLDWCGEMQILPTATDPLSAMDGYTGMRSSVFPHAKAAMRSVAVGEDTKFMYTTGSATLPNYIQKKAGLKAQFHHSIGCLLVEVSGTRRDWWARQVSAQEDGSLQDLLAVVKDGKVSTGEVEAIVWGDIHAKQMDPTVKIAGWGYNGSSMMKVLKPKAQFLHDLFDGYAVAKHERKGKNHHELYKRFLDSDLDMDREIRETRGLLASLTCEGCKTYVVNSNHDAMLYHWLNHTNYRKDMLNAEFLLELELKLHRHIKKHRELPNILRTVMDEQGNMNNVVFLDEDESVVLCPDSSGGIECGMHGHRGLNGAKGNIKMFARMGRKSVVGHSHSAGIFEGCYQVGTSGLLRPGYNVGPSSWSHTHCVIYPSGKRTLVHMKKGKWRAE